MSEPGFRVVRSSTIAEVGFLTVEQLAVGDADGHEHTRIVVRHPGAVSVVPIDADDRVVLVRQYRAAVGRALLEIPAGKRDVRGEPPEVTAARELEEEIGARPGRLVALAEFYNSPGFTDEYGYVFAGLDLSFAGTRDPQGPEERAMSVERVRLADADDLIASREVVDAKTIIGLLLTRKLLTAPAAPGGA